MFSQYPHTIQIELAGTPTQDAIGNFHIPAGTRFESVCRAKKTSGGEKTEAPDGSQVFIHWAVSMPCHQNEIPYGSKATLTLLNGSVHTGTVKSYENGQLHSRVWL